MAIVCFRIKEKEPGGCPTLFLGLFYFISWELTPLIFTRAMLQPTTERRKNSPCRALFTFSLYPSNHCAYNAKNGTTFVVPFFVCRRTTMFRIVLWWWPVREDASPARSPVETARLLFEPNSGCFAPREGSCAERISKTKKDTREECPFRFGEPMPS